MRPAGILPAGCGTRTGWKQVGVSFRALDLHTLLTEDLGMDDLDPVEAVMALEGAFHITIPADDAGQLDTVSMLVQYIHTRTQ